MHNGKKKGNTSKKQVVQSDWKPGKAQNDEEDRQEGSRCSDYEESNMLH